MAERSDIGDSFVRSFDGVNSDARSGAPPISAPWPGRWRNAICPECLAEIRDPANRRYRYPFTSCRDCGPGFTITRRLPYERANTTMAPFQLCEVCRREYEDPDGRRYHSPTLCCPDCGPAYWIEPAPPVAGTRDVISEAARLLREGSILAVKDGCSFRLLCRATDETLVRRLRRRKQREHMPLGVMVRDLEAATELAELDAPSRELLSAPSGPMVIVPRRRDDPLAPSVAPDRAEIGLVLPRSAFHHLLFDELDEPIVVTSANAAGDVMVWENDDAREHLMAIADLLVLHDLELNSGCEDSVVRIYAQEGPVILRRSSGYAANPLLLPRKSPVILALGGLHDATVAIAHGEQVHLSQPMGDLESPRAVESFDETLQRMLDLWRCEPEFVAYDLHPLSYGHRIRDRFGVPAIGVQHHHAHMASVLAEHGLEGPVLGISLDATAHRFDESIGSGEFLAGDAIRYRSLGRSPRFRVPGADVAIRHPWRTATGLLYDLLGADTARRWATENAPNADAAQNTLSMLDHDVDCISITSFGRIYDALAALLGLCVAGRSQSHAASQLETVAGPLRELDHESFPSVEGKPAEYLEHLLRELLERRRGGEGVEVLAAWAQEALARWVSRTAVDLAGQEELSTVVAAGGCLGNPWLRWRLLRACEEAGLAFYANRKVPPGDGGLSLGQAWVVANRVGVEQHR